MDKESLIKARNIIIKALDKSDIKQIDKLELILNLHTLLDRDNYEKDIKVLIKNKEKKWKK